MFVIGCGTLKTGPDDFEKAKKNCETVGGVFEALQTVELNRRASRPSGTALRRSRCSATLPTASSVQAMCSRPPPVVPGENPVLRVSLALSRQETRLGARSLLAGLVAASRGRRRMKRTRLSSVN